MPAPISCATAAVGRAMVCRGYAVACRGRVVGVVEESRCYQVEEPLLLLPNGCCWLLLHPNGCCVWLCWRGGVARVIFAALVFVEEESVVAYLLWCEDCGVVDGACIWRFCICIQMERPDFLPVAEVEVW